MKEKEMKTLANCTDEEALVQFNKVRKLINEWCDATDIINIRKRLPAFETIPANADIDQVQQINEKNDRLRREQGLKNLGAILDSALEANRELTLKVIRVCCFRDPDDNTLKFIDLLHAANDIISNREIINFFIYTTDLGKNLGLTL